MRYCLSNVKLHLRGPGGSGEPGKRTLCMALRISERQRQRIVTVNQVSMYEK